MWQSECHPVGRVLSSGLPPPLTLPSGKTDDTNEGWLRVSWHPTRTHCCYCATLSPLPPGSHRRRSLRKYTHQRKRWRGDWGNSSNLGRHDRSGLKRCYYSALVEQTVGLNLLDWILLRKKKQPVSNGGWVEDLNLVCLCRKQEEVTSLRLQGSDRAN